jgi:hypothetical protein
VVLCFYHPTSGLFKPKPIRKIIRSFAGDRAKNPMEVKFQETSNVSKLTRLHRAVQIPAKIVDDPINSFRRIVRWPGFCGWHGFY